MARIRNVFFDYGNTLAFANLEATLAPLRTRGASPSEDQLRRAEIGARLALDDLRAHNAPNPDAAYWHLFFDRLLPNLGIPEDGVRTELISAFRTSLNWTRVLPGTEDVLQRLHARYQLAVISNADGSIATLLEQVGLAQYFRSVTDSGVVGHQKPAAEIFRIALDSIGAAAADSVYIGDVYSVDYVGATNVGMKAVLMDHVGAYTEMTVPRISRLVELESVLDCL
jgi:putative hydrolase of the HAD superfamily